MSERSPSPELATSEVLAASQRFYAALDACLRGDVAPMSALWWQDASVTCGHPWGEWARGWNDVWQSWVHWGRTTNDGTINVDEIEARIFGDVAYTLGVEHVKAVFAGVQKEFTAQVTNVYRRIDGQWLIVHHHVDRGSLPG